MVYHYYYCYCIAYDRAFYPGRCCLCTFLQIGTVLGAAQVRVVACRTCTCLRSCHNQQWAARRGVLQCRRCAVSAAAAKPCISVLLLFAASDKVHSALILLFLPSFFPHLQVKKFFRPEFLNRLDDIVVFDPLSAHQLLGVAGLMAHELNDRLKSKNITLKTTDNALQYAVSQVGLVLLYNTRCPTASGRELSHSPRRSCNQKRS